MYVIVLVYVQTTILLVSTNVHSSQGLHCNDFQIITVERKLLCKLTFPGEYFCLLVAVFPLCLCKNNVKLCTGLSRCSGTLTVSGIIHSPHCGLTSLAVCTPYMRCILCVL